MRWRCLGCPLARIRPPARRRAPRKPPRVTGQPWPGLCAHPPMPFTISARPGLAFRGVALARPCAALALDIKTALTPEGERRRTACLPRTQLRPTQRQVGRSSPVIKAGLPPTCPARMGMRRRGSDLWPSGLGRAGPVPLSSRHLWRAWCRHRLRAPSPSTAMSFMRGSPTRLSPPCRPVRHWSWTCHLL